MGRTISLKVVSARDLGRAVEWSSACRLVVPEFDLDLAAGVIHAGQTTIIDLLKQVYTYLGPKLHDEQGEVLLDKLHCACCGGMEFTLVVDDPTGEFWIQNPFAPDDDPNMMIEVLTEE